MALQPAQRITAQRLRDNAPWTAGYASITASTAATTSSTPQAAITTDPILFRAGRAYRLSYRGGLTSSTLGQQGTVLITRGTAGGATLLNSQRIPCAAGQAGTVGFYFENIIAVGGTDVTTALVGTYQMVFQVSSGTVAIFGSATTPAYIEVTDIGLAADYPGATPM
ncbi:hypothetical protein [Streptomyces sp. NPDC058280]|uniref:hypothetical protein n=1 Tax=Streptomyces sp. NPDC058280 TaxID=3346419 RepID=UPI0036EFBE0B